MIKVFTSRFFTAGIKIYMLIGEWVQFSADPPSMLKLDWIGGKYEEWKKTKSELKLGKGIKTPIYRGGNT